MYRRKILAILLSAVVAIAFMPAIAFAEDYSITDQQVSNDGKSYEITLNKPGFQVKQILVPWTKSEYLLKEGTEYKISGKKITINKELLDGETGYKPTRLDIWAEITLDGMSEVLSTNNFNAYNISKISRKASANRVYSGKQKYAQINIFPGVDLKKGTDYKVVYGKSTRKAIGKYYYTVKGIGKYTGSFKGSFKIIPKAPSKITSAKRTKTTATIKWKKVSNCTGYQVQLYKKQWDNDEWIYYDKVYKSVKLKGKSKLSKKFTKATKSKYTHARVRAYKVVNGTPIYSKWVTKKF